MMQVTDDVFDREAAQYDAWYDTPHGQAIFDEEIEALRPLLGGLPRPWLEVGIGSGRFAAGLGAEVGLDPAPGPLRLAGRRGIHIVRGIGEAVPFADGTFGAVLLMVTLCFVADAGAVLREAQRVLRADGGVVLGLILAEGPWGRHYRSLAEQGDPFYRQASFFTRTELASLLAQSGLRAVRWRSALYWLPTSEPVRGGTREGDNPMAGFTALLASAQDTTAHPLVQEQERTRISPITESRP